MTTRKRRQTRWRTEPGRAAIPSLEGNPEAIAAGKGIYSANCSPCHGAGGQGGIGPNLTDDYWLHGHTHKGIVNVVTQGVPAKGMIAWKAILNPRKIQQVAAFVGSLKDSNPIRSRTRQRKPRQRSWSGSQRLNGKN